MSGELTAAGLSAIGSVASRQDQWSRPRARPIDADCDDLPEEDRDELEAEFTVHVRAAASQLSDFADELASGDPVLRERLRVVERLGG